MSSPAPLSGLFRQEAVEHHYRDPESVDVVDRRPRWTWPVILVSATLVTAVAAYAFVLHPEVAYALRERLLQ
jgi:hypothetical protein